METRNIVALLATAALASGLTACTSSPRNTKVEMGSDTIDASLPTQLPRTAVPSHYAITFTPNADKLTFDASVAIDLKVIKPTRELVVNAVDLAISHATLTPWNRQ